MLAAGIEQEPCARLDDHAEAEVAQALGHRCDPAAEFGGERVEMVVVQGDGYAVVAQVGEQRNAPKLLVHSALTSTARCKTLASP